ncbi:hypothetical protein H0G86_002591 [Trichoderma simmonsii]|uniref:Zn(2)-C6 fungal-type domain-containing protein n=1 Tax=Trichoderma simmonsii TaxID=1491479 RepID=A0A8G0PBP7_9HYPO|nr:hypothetical protein H0G86_002591 [Trichoderma simmonsii]
MDSHPSNLVSRRRACVACTSVKQKCILHRPNMCQRCERLGKECVFLELSQRKRKRSESRRVEKLENTVNQLITHLTGLTGQDVTPLASPSRTTQSVISSAEGMLAIPSNSSLSQSGNLQDRSPEPVIGHESACSVVLEALNNDETEALLQKFQQKFVPIFPFAAISVYKGSYHIRHLNPFLFLCIVAVTIGPKHPLWAHVQHEVMNQGIRRMMLGLERNLDLLRGFLVLASWCHLFPFNHSSRPDVLNLVQTCITLCYTLNLEHKAKLTLEEQRALLGTYWISKCAEKAFSKPIGLKYGDAIQNACKSLSEISEYPHDRDIQPQIASRFLIGRIYEAFTSLRGMQAPDIWDAPVGLMRCLFKRELDVIEIGVNQQQNLTEPLGSLNGHLARLDIHHVSICMGECAVQSQQPWLHCIDSDPPSITDNITFGSSAERIAIIYKTMRACKLFILGFLEIPTADLTYVTFVTYSQLCFTLTTYAKLVWALLEIVVGGATYGDRTVLVTLTADQNSQCAAIVDEADYLGFLGLLLKKVEKAAEGNMDAQDRETNFISVFTSKLRLFALSYPIRVNGILGTDLLDTPRDTDYTGEITSHKITAHQFGQGADDKLEHWLLRDSATQEYPKLPDNLLWNSFFTDFDLNSLINRPDSINSI